MKKVFILFAVIVMSVTMAVPAVAQDWGRLLQAGVKGVQSLTLSDAQIQNYVKQYVASLDAKSQVADETSPYTVRLNKIVKGVTQVNGIPLNFKVYITKDVNAFACADGSVRVYSGLMDLMSDDEVLGVIGHEIGHVAHKDTKNAFKNALQTSALRDIIGSAGGTIAALSDSQLGAIGETLLQKGYSRKQESNADNYAYDYLKSLGKNPLTMALAFKKLNSVSGGSTNALMQAFSDHPDTNKRIANIEKRAKADGFKYPSAKSTKSISSASAKSTSSVKTVSSEKTTVSSTGKTTTKSKKSGSSSSKKSSSKKSSSKKSSSKKSS